MELSQKRMRKQLERMKPLITGCSMELARKGQDALGALLSRSYHKEVRVEEVCFPGFPACRIVPRDQSPVGRMLYLHGGGYVCGDLEYAKGFGSVLSAVTGAEVLCPAYRLAPEHPFPAGLEDSFSAYQFLLEQEGPVVLCRRICRGRHDLCPVLSGEGEGPAPASGPHWHFALDGSHRLRQLIRRESGAGPLHDPRAAGPVCQLLHRMPGQPFGLSLVWRFDWVSTQPPVCGRG